MGGSGVQRPLKFIKYLREFGWNPIVLCPETGSYQVFDGSLQKELDEMNIEVYRVKASTPFHFLGQKKSKNLISVSNKKAQFLRKISKLIYYPDNKRAWIKPAITKGKELFEEKNIDLIFSSAPPFSNHLAASELKKITGVPVVLDYRDSWLNNHFMTDMFSWQRKIMMKMERSCLENADTIIGLDKHMVNDISNNHPELKLKTEIVSHGFDPEDFNLDMDTKFDYKKGKLNLLYSGLFYESNQPDILLEALEAIFKDDSDVKNKIHLHFQGGLDKRINKLIEKLGFTSIVTDYGYLNHNEAVKNLVKADALWMISNFSENLKQIKSGKLFEYIGSEKPIIGFVHEGEASKLLETYKAGFFASPNNSTQVKRVIKDFLVKWEAGDLPTPNQGVIQKHNRKFLTNELASIFNVISA